jgi:hypothetical protein
MPGGGFVRDKYSYVQGAPPAHANALIATRLAAVQGYVGNFFTQAKATLKAAATTATNQLQNGLAAPNPNVVQIFRTYEAAHLAIGNQTYAELEQALKTYVQTAYNTNFPLTWGGPRPPAGDLRVDLRLANQVNGSADVQVLVRVPTNAQPVQWIAAQWTVGCVYQDVARFQALAVGLQPANRQNDVYFKRNLPHQHYVSYVRGGTTYYVRRYVIRGLNQQDSFQISQGNGLIAPEQGLNATGNEVQQPGVFPGKHNVQVGIALTDQQQILSHTRGWKKRFISATTTLRPAYSTRGQEFRSVFGKIIIDLAFVPGGDIFDLHTPDALATLNTNAQQILNSPHQPNPTVRSLQDEEVLAGRDVIRTRELLIRFQVPLAAIRTLSLGNNVIGIWHLGAFDIAHRSFQTVETAWTQTHQPWLETETLEYQWNNKWYKFYRFANAASANNAWAAVPQNLHTQREQLAEYDFPNPLPLGYTR